MCTSGCTYYLQTETYYTNVPYHQLSLYTPTNQGIWQEPLTQTHVVLLGWCVAWVMVWSPFHINHLSKHFHKDTNLWVLVHHWFWQMTAGWLLTAGPPGFSHSRESWPYLVLNLASCICLARILSLPISSLPGSRPWAGMKSLPVFWLITSGHFDSCNFVSFQTWNNVQMNSRYK